MEIEYDREKSARNAAERDLPFAFAQHIDWTRALTAIDNRVDYGETRYVALAPREGRLYVICYVIRGEKRRIISLRKANRREERAYDSATLDR